MKNYDLFSKTFSLHSHLILTDIIKEAQEKNSNFIQLSFFNNDKDNSKDNDKKKGD